MELIEYIRLRNKMTMKEWEDTIERTLKKLQEKGLLVRTGAKKSGSWIVIK